MVGIALWFRPGVFLCAEVPACAPGDVGLESQGAPLSGQAARHRLCNGISMWGTAAGHSCRSSEMTKKRSTCLGTTWSFPGRGSI